MPRLISPLNIFFIAACLILGIQSCKQPANSANAGKAQAADSTKVKQLIDDGKRLENINNDSLLTVSLDLYQLNKQTGNNTAMVYAEVFEGTHYWQAFDQKKAMGLALAALADAQKLGVKQALPQIYALIGNLHKETTNYAMAFKAADNGLNAAISNKDTAEIIALLGLKAMFTRGLSLNHHLSTINDKSLPLNLEALKMAEASPKYEKLRIRFYDNICQFYKDKRLFDSAYYYGNKGVALALKYNQQRSLTYSYSWLGEANYYQGKQAIGLDYLNRAMQIAVRLNEPYRVMEVNQSYYNCYNSSRNYKEAMHYYGIATKMRDSLKVLDNVKQISELQIKYEAAVKDEKISSLKAQDDMEALELKAAVVVLVLLVVIGVLIYIKEKKRKVLLLSEKNIVDIELNNATLELQYFTDNLTQKNELIEEFNAKIEHLQNVNKADMEGLEKLVKEHIMTDEKWENFKRLFTKVNAGFFNNVRNKYPHLTPTDTRMLCLIKLQLGNYEMGNMLGVTLEGIKKSKQRLRKKMELDKDESLEAIVEAL